MFPNYYSKILFLKSVISKLFQKCFICPTPPPKKSSYSQIFLKTNNFNIPKLFSRTFIFPNCSQELSYFQIFLKSFSIPKFVVIIHTPKLFSKTCIFLKFSLKFFRSSQKFSQIYFDNHELF